MYPNGLDKEHRIDAPIRMGRNNAKNAMCVSQFAWYFTLVFNGLKQLAQRIPNVENSTEAGTKTKKEMKIKESIEKWLKFVPFFYGFVEF